MVANGIGNWTVERNAEHSGIAKTTIYRRWPNAAAIVMDGFLDEIGLEGSRLQSQ
ncbi:hypothetical protein BH11PSE13_BH11PSE13_32350 [soil metagenome]